VHAIAAFGKMKAFKFKIIQNLRNIGGIDEANCVANKFSITTENHIQ
jgi:hypothetical protein